MPRVPGRLQDWLIVGSGALMLAGVALISRAAVAGELGSTLFSLWHIPLYAGVVLAMYALLAGTTDTRLGRTRVRDAIPVAYRLSGVGVLLFALGFTLDLAWQALAGDTTDALALVTPTHLLAFAGIALVLVGPLRAPTTRAGEGYVAQLPAVLAIGLLVALGGGLTQFANPVTQVLAERTSGPPILAGASEIWAMAPDGSGQTRQTIAGNGADTDPTWSRDGTVRAQSVWTYVNGKDPTTPDGVTSHITIEGRDGQAIGVVIATGSWVAGPVFSPDRSRVAVNLFRVFAGTEQAPTSATPTPALAGAGPQPNNPPGPVDTSVASFAGREWDVALASAAGASVPTLLQALPGTDIVSDWSPDGASLLEHSDRSGNFDIYRVDVATGTVTDLTNNRAIDDWAAWSPDGSTIAFSSDRDGITHLWLMNADGSGARQLTFGASPDWLPAWSPDGRQLAFLSNREGSSTDIYRINVDGTAIRNLTRTPALNEWMTAGAWSHDGQQILYAASQANPPSVNDLAIPLALASIILWSGLLTALFLFAIRLGRLPFGGTAIALTIGVAALAVVSERYALVPAAAAAGLVVDLLVRWVRPQQGGSPHLVVGFCLPAVTMAGYLITLAVGGTLGWSVWVGISAVCLAGVTGLAVASAIGSVVNADNQGRTAA